MTLAVVPGEQIDSPSHVLKLKHTSSIGRQLLSTKRSSSASVYVRIGKHVSMADTGQGTHRPHGNRLDTSAREQRAKETVSLTCCTTHVVGGRLLNMPVAG